MQVFSDNFPLRAFIVVPNSVVGLNSVCFLSGKIQLRKEQYKYFGVSLVSRKTYSKNVKPRMKTRLKSSGKFGSAKSNDFLPSCMTFEDRRRKYACFAN